MLTNTIGMRILVIENDIGVEGIDHDILIPHSNVKKDIVLMNNGCNCCTVRQDLVSTFRHVKSYDWIIRSEKYPTKAVRIYLASLSRIRFGMCECSCHPLKLLAAVCCFWDFLLCALHEFTSHSHWDSFPVAAGNHESAHSALSVPLSIEFSRLLVWAHSYVRKEFPELYTSLGDHAVELFCISQLKNSTERLCSSQQCPVRHLFDTFDENGDGSISREELIKGLFPHLALLSILVCLSTGNRDVDHNCWLFSDRGENRRSEGDGYHEQGCWRGASEPPEAHSAMRWSRCAAAAGLRLHLCRLFPPPRSCSPQCSCLSLNWQPRCWP